jgi:hypothetical protein
MTRGSHCIGGWVGPRASLDGWNIFALRRTLVSCLNVHFLVPFKINSGLEKEEDGHILTVLCWGLKKNFCSRLQKHTKGQEYKQSSPTDRHSITSQKTWIFNNMSVRTSSLAKLTLVWPIIRGKWCMLDIYNYVAKVQFPLIKNFSCVLHTSPISSSLICSPQ